MATKHVYLVRHGETADNRRWVHQSINISLNEKGKREASAVARALGALPIDTLLSSDAERARETAAAIAAELRLKSRTEEIFRELHRGVLLEGEHHLSVRSVKGSLLMFLKAGNGSWHFGNGENVSEFRNRIGQIEEILAEHSGEHIIVVTHRGVINALRFMAKHRLDGSLYRFAFAAVLGRVKNGSITELTYDPARTASWHIERANDTRHLRGL